MKNPVRLLLLGALCVSASAQAMTDAELATITGKRLLGDRSGACFAVAVIDGTVSRAIVCADPANARKIDTGTAFEIGSVSKTFTAALLAEKIAAGTMSLDDPLSKYLPAGTVVPSFDGKPILLRHLVTHTSGLPALPKRMKAASPDNPYANVTREQLLGSLADVTLTAAPGTDWAYSNYAMMLLSMVLADQSRTSFESLLSRDILTPLGMTHSFVDQPPAGVVLADGHLGNGKPTAHWTLGADSAGVGGIRASLDDMVIYVQAQLGLRPTKLPLAMTQQRVGGVGGRPMAMNWLIAPLDGVDTFAHEGGTGGFSSFVAFNPATKRGVVILSDTAMTSVGGLGSLGRHLLDSRLPLGEPRKVVAATAAQLQALAGDYVLDNGMTMQLSRDQDKLGVTVPGQGHFTMRMDSSGDFFPDDFDAILRPQKQAGGALAFTWLQGGGAMAAKRTDATTKPMVPALVLSATDLAAYEGVFRLAPAFAITITSKDGKLFAQGTGQGALEIAPAGKDVFVAPRVGAEMEFVRRADGAVEALLLKQGGAVQRAARE